MNAGLKPYFARSLGLHALGAAAFALILTRSARRADKVYMIDFVGAPASAVAVSAPAASSAPAAAASAPQTDEDSLSVRRRRRGPISLPKPSLLRGVRDTRTRTASMRETSLAGRGAPTPTMRPTASSSLTATATGPGASASGAGIATDLPNFPFPWYIAQMRLMLWQSWQRRMPRLDAEGSVSFSILRNGSITDLSVESSSGDSQFDKAAMTSVQSAAPFPALPAAFKERFLKIHLTLKSEEAWR